jgi:uncharacterized protein (TIGR02266 family)
LSQRAGIRYTGIDKNIARCPPFDEIMMSDQGDSRNRRRSKRINTRIRILFTRGGSGVAIEAETDDISVDGVFVRTRRRPPSEGTKLGLLLSLEDPAQELMLKGIVARVSEADSESEQSSGMGIRFVDVDDGTRKVLAQALERAEEAAVPPQDADDRTT